MVPAVVATATENFPKPPVVRVSGLGDTVQVDAAGAPVQAKFTFPEKSAAGVAVMSNVAVPPAATVADDVLAATEKPVAPMPAKGIVCGLSVALSVKVSVPVRLPLTVGVKVTLTVQLLLAGMNVPQVLDSPKSLPVWIRVMPACSSPELVSVTVWAALVVPTAWLPKEMLPGATVSIVMAPCPMSSTVRGLPAELSVIVRVPLRVPVVVGVKVTWIVQTPPAGDTVPQLFWMEKSAVAVAFDTVRAALPKSSTVMVCGLLGVPTC